MSTKKVNLTTWAALHYDPPPSAWVLRQWVRRGEIVPAPERVGRMIYVEQTARRLTVPSVTTIPLVQRLKNAA